jgi:hypothetical protein
MEIAVDQDRDTVAVVVRDRDIVVGPDMEIAVDQDRDTELMAGRDRDIVAVVVEGSATEPVVVAAAIDLDRNMVVIVGEPPMVVARVARADRKVVDYP